MSAFLSTLPSRVFYAVDAALGLARGGSCPNCGRAGHDNIVVRRKSAGLIPIWSCHGCGLLYRPVSFRGGLLLEAYYSFFYTQAGPATWPQLRYSAQASSDVLLGIVPPPATVCSFGCSWGYEPLVLREAGYEAVGIEVGRRRREYGRETLGVVVYPSIEEAAAKATSIDVVMSSHVLEHIPNVDAVVADLTRQLHPRVQIHKTPNVENVVTGAEAPSLIGREHPIGVTRRYWEHLAQSLGLALDLRENTYEMTAILRS